MAHKTEQSDQAPNDEKPEICYCSALPKGSGPCLPCYTRWLARSAKTRFVRQFQISQPAVFMCANGSRRPSLCSTYAKFLIGIWSHKREVSYGIRPREALRVSTAT